MRTTSTGQHQKPPLAHPAGRMAASVLALAITAAGLLALTPLAHAETLREALALTYQSNPRLDAERARLRSTDESVPQAKAGFRPRASIEADTGHQRITTTPRRFVQ
jgi:outer membrane protein TolC